MWFKVVMLTFVIVKCIQHVLQLLNPGTPRWAKGVRVVIFLQLGSVGVFAFLTSYPPAADGFLQTTILSLFVVAATEAWLELVLSEDFLRELPKILVERKKRRGK
jgi:hypothetical protein